MNVQLTLIESSEAPVDWQLDDETRTVGIEGLRTAREALAAARATIEAQHLTTSDLTDVELPAAA